MPPNKLTTLSAVAKNVTARIEEVDLAPDLTRRLTELGFTKGAAVTPLYRSFHEAVGAYGVRRTVIALRRADAEKIYVTEEV